MSTMILNFSSMIMIVLAAIVVYCLIKFFSVTRGKAVMDLESYDERQQLISAKGYYLAFWTSFLIGMFYYALSDMIFPAVSTNFVLATLVWVPFSVCNIHNIWYGAYLPFEQKKSSRPRLFIAYAILGVAWLSLSFLKIIFGEAGPFFSTEGIGAGLVTGFSMLSQTLVFIYRSYLDQKAGEDD